MVVIVWNYRFICIGKGDASQHLMCTDVLAAAETTPAAICVRRDLTPRMSDGDKIVALYPWCVFDETPICSKQEWHGENKLEDFCPELSFCHVDGVFLLDDTYLPSWSWFHLSGFPKLEIGDEEAQRD